MHHHLCDNNVEEPWMQAGATFAPPAKRKKQRGKAGGYGVSGHLLKASARSLSFGELAVAPQMLALCQMVFKHSSELNS